MVDHTATFRASVAEVLTLDDLAGAPLASLAATLGASQSLVYAYDGGPLPHLVGGTLIQGAADYTPALFAADPLHPYMSALTPRLVLEPDPDVQLRVHRSPVYADFYRRADAHHYLGVWPTGQTYAAPGMFGVLLTRGRHQGPFDPRAVRQLAALSVELRALGRRVGRVARLARDQALYAQLGRAGASAFAWRLDGALVFGSDDAYAALAEIGQDPRAAWLAGRPIAARWRRGEATPPRACERLLEGADADVEITFTVRSSGVAEPLLVGVVERVTHIARRARSLTPAERRVLDALADGARNRDVADALGVSVDTVKTHVKRVLAKLGARSRSEAAVIGATLRAPAEIRRRHPLE